MTRVRTTEALVLANTGQRVLIRGWLHALRRFGGIAFVIVRDGWGILQAVATEEDTLTPLREAEAGVESIIEIEGTLIESAQAPGGVELVEPTIRVIAPVREALPVEINKPRIKAGQAVVLDHAALTLRHPSRRAVFKLSAGAMAGFRSTLSSLGFTEVQTPKIVASATESGANVFEIGYFGRQAYLAQSPQFYKQMMVGVFERVFEVGPVFRAEPHATPRHINEYVSLDVEMGFIENHFTVMGVVREVLAGMVAHLGSHCAEALAQLKLSLPEVPEQIPHIHFGEAKALLASRFGIQEVEEPDLSPSEERALGQWAQEQHHSAFLFVVGYPMAKRPFYTHPEPARPAHSNSFDLLFRGTELITGGQRLHRHEDYLEALSAAGMSPAPFEPYLEAFRYGMPPHGGFAIGLERFLMQLTGEPNLRATTLFPRDIQRLTP